MQKRKRIALYLNALAIGGIARVALNLASGFLAEGIDVDVVLSKREGVYLPLFEEKKINIVDLGCKSHNAFPILKFSRYIVTQKPNAVIAMGGFQNGVAVFARFFSKTNTRLMITDHGVTSYPNLNPRNSFFEKTIIILAYRMFARLSFRFADSIVALSQNSADSLTKTAWLGAKRIQVIYNPVVAGELLLNAQRPVAHAWLQDKSKKIVLAAGRLHPQKDFPTLLKAFHNVRQEMECKLIILGDGPGKDALAELADTLGITNDLDIVGFVENPYAYMSKADVFVSSSINEGLPTVVIEALACGCPVIATNCPGGSSEILQNGEYGTLVPVGNAAAMGDAIYNVLTGITTYPREQLLKRAQDFSLEKAIANYRKTLNI